MQQNKIDELLEVLTYRRLLRFSSFTFTRETPPPVQRFSIPSGLIAFSGGERKLDTLLFCRSDRLKYNFLYLKIGFSSLIQNLGTISQVFTRNGDDKEVTSNFRDDSSCRGTTCHSGSNFFNNVEDIGIAVV